MRACGHALRWAQMGPESSRVTVKDLAQEGLIIVTIFEAELSAVTFPCAPEQPIP
jgi:hypothetical protein